MRKLAYLPLAAALFAVPALAQSTSTTPAQTTTSPTSAMQARQKIETQLQQDGFKNVHVVADSFLVHATNKEGQSVVMIINPDSVFSITDVGKTVNNTGNDAGPGKTASK